MVNLQKGQKIDLTKDNNDLSIAMVGLGWDAVNRFARPHVSSDYWYI